MTTSGKVTDITAQMKAVRESIKTLSDLGLNTSDLESTLQALDVAANTDARDVALNALPVKLTSGRMLIAIYDSKGKLSQHVCAIAATKGLRVTVTPTEGTAYSIAAKSYTPRAAGSGGGKTKRFTVVDWGKTPEEIKNKAIPGAVYDGYPGLGKALGVDSVKVLEGRKHNSQYILWAKYWQVKIAPVGGESKPTK